MNLRWRLTLLYSALLVFLLALVAVSTFVLMRDRLIKNLDNSVSDTFLQVKETYGRSDAVLMSLYDYFPGTAIQTEDLGDMGEDAVLEAVQLALQENRAEQFFQGELRKRQDATREITNFSQKQPIRLTTDELSQLFTSPSGRIFVNRDLAVNLNDDAKLTPYRLLVGVGAMQLRGRNAYAITYVGKSLTGVYDTMTELQRVLAFLCVSGIVLSTFAAYMLAGQALTPLRQVQQAAEGITGQNLAERVPEPRSKDEVHALAASLNAMLGRLEASFEAQRRFTSDASHELRTPVTAITGHASYLLRRTNPTEQQQESLRIIQTESERLTNLIASLLQLARSDSGALQLSLQPVFSGMLLSEISRELAPLAAAQNTSLTVRGGDLAFEGDPDRLKQVLINLVGNALKAGAKNIVLESQPQEQGRELRLSVRDDGPGIPPEHLEKLFDRFYRVEDSRSRDQGGAGLGLSIARSIVEAHHGRIWLESQVGQGTTAHVQLPVGDVPVLDDEDVP